MKLVVITYQKVLKLQNFVRFRYQPYFHHFERTVEVKRHNAINSEYESRIQRWWKSTPGSHTICQANVTEPVKNKVLKSFFIPEEQRKLNTFANTEVAPFLVLS